MLDLARLYGQVERLVERRRETFPALRERVERAAADLTALRSRAAAARTPWLVASPLEPPGAVHPLPPRPAEYAALAVDGSQIPPDRHAPLLCYVLNVAGVYIRYGERAAVRFTTEPRLFYEDQDVYEVVDGVRVRIGDAGLAAHRTQMEFAALEALIGETADIGVPAVAFVDGTLILWTLWNARSETVRRTGLEVLIRLLDRARAGGIPVVGYISDPGSGEAANLARVLLCPMDRPDCGDCRYLKAGDPPCAAAEVADAALFRLLLTRPGQRSAVFESRSRILERYAEAHRTCFFYLDVGAEVARLEVPRWVADDRAMLDLVHAAAYDQAAKGLGYPVVIDEAHKQAVVTGAERQAFLLLLDNILAGRGLRSEISAKLHAKRGGIL